MFKIRLRDLSAGLALSYSLVPFSTLSGQVVVQGFPLNLASETSAVTPSRGSSAVATQHLGNGPIDMNNLPADILNCEVCRQRLGLPPLRWLSPSGSSPTASAALPTASAALPSPKTLPMPKPETVQPQKTDLQPVPMLGSPGLISSGTASQMERLGIVVEEFKPPQPQPDSIRLGEIPPEVRQQFLKGLDLPSGSKIMSAEVVGKSGEASATESEIVRADAQSSLFAPTLVEPIPTEAIRPLDIPEIHSKLQLEPAVLEKNDEANKAIGVEREELANAKKKMDAQWEQMQLEWQKRMELADAANKETLALLEKRTAEVTELQTLLNAQRETLAKLQSELNEKKSEPDRPNKSKKTESNKKPEAKKKSDKQKQAAPDKSLIDT